MSNKSEFARKKKRRLSVRDGEAVMRENDDEAEMQLVRTERAVATSSPFASPAVRNARAPRRPMAGTTLAFDEDQDTKTTEPSYSNSELSDIYQNCIKLSAQGKISVKNTWTLPLIGQLNQVMNLDSEEDAAPTTTARLEPRQPKKKKSALDKKAKDKQSKSIYNFQMASCTLEASVKIYSTRVDSVHTETFKVMGGLSRGANDKKRSNNDDGDQPTRKERSRTSKPRDASNTIESNVANLNAKQNEIEFDVESLQMFHRTSAVFDEGGARGLLMNQMGISEGCYLMFEDSKVQATTTCTASDETIDCDLITDLLPSIDSERICPPLATFMFTGWNPNDDGNASALDLPVVDNMPPEVSEFDGDALEQFEGAFEPAAHNFYDDDLPDMDTHVYDDEYDDAPMGDGQYGAPNPGMGTRMVPVEGATTAGVAISKGNDFSFFDEKMLQNNWSGPSHWKVQMNNAATEGKTVSTKKAKRQEKVLIDFEEEDETNYDEAFARPPRGGGTRLTEATLKRLAASTNCLPDDIHYDIKRLCSLFCKPTCRLRRTTISTGETMMVVADDSPTNNDFGENANNDEGFTMNLGQDMGAGYEDDGYDVAFDYDEDMVGQAVPEAEAPAALDMGAMDLIDAPETVESLSINYAKVAKKVDVKKLKTSLWGELVRDEGVDPKKPSPKKNNAPASEEMTEVKSFKQVLQTLPQSLPQRQKENISVPFCFICLLHLANEKGLEIQENAGDLTIAQE